MQHFPERVKLGERFPEMLGVDAPGADQGDLVFQLSEARIQLSDRPFGFPEVIGDRRQRLFRVCKNCNEPLDLLALALP
jgi:hypothetical protein